MYFSRIKQLKYFLMGLIAGEYPKKTLTSILFADSQNFGELGSNPNRNNCFITWKAPKLTKTHASSYQKFIEDNQDYQFTFFDDQSMHQWMQEYCEDKVILNIFNNSEFSASKADIFRLVVLYTYGGVYTSINRTFTSPISSVIVSRDKFAISFERFRYVREDPGSKLPKEFRDFSIVQHTIAAPKGHQLLEVAMDEIKRNTSFYMGRSFPKVKEAIWQYTASLMLTRAVDTYLNSNSKEDFFFLGFEFNDSVKIPLGSQYRYASSPSYLGARNKPILKPF